MSGMSALRPYRLLFNIVSNENYVSFIKIQIFYLIRVLLVCR